MISAISLINIPS